jgi:signal recognition particle subunit SRP54
MTLAKRRNPAILDASRRCRIAKGSGTSVQEINALLNQFEQRQKVMKQLCAGRMPKMFAGLRR